MDSIRPYLEVRYARGPSFSASGRRMVFLYDGPGAAQVYLIELNPADPSDSAASWDRWPRQLTFHEDRVTFCRFLPGSETQVLYGRDHGGDEKEEFFLLDLESGREELLTGTPRAMNAFGALSRDGTRLAYASTLRHPACFDICLLDLETRERRTLLEAANHEEGWNRALAFSPDGTSLYVVRHRMPLWNELWELPIDRKGKPRLLGSAEKPTLYHAAAVHPTSGAIYLAEDRESDRLNLSWLDPESARFAPAVEAGWDVEELAFNPDGTRLAYTVNREGVSQLRVLEIDTGRDRRVEGVPVGVIEDLTFAPDGGRVAFTLSGDRHPTNVWIAPMGGNAKPFPATQAPVGRLPLGSLLPGRLERFRSFDGLEVPTWVLGDGERAVIVIHGGPEGQARPSYNPVAQYLAKRGFKVFLPNVRGSSGYGRHYLSLDDVRKRMDSVKDIVALREWIAATRCADPARLAVMGGSYGGFMTLACVTEYPDLWKAGIDFVGIANFRTFLMNTGAYRRRMREAEYGSLEADGAFLDSISPIHKADRIACPMLIAHGANDPRVPLSEAEQIVAALTRRGSPCEFLVFPDEGHGVAKRPNRITLYERVAAFLEAHL